MTWQLACRSPGPRRGIEPRLWVVAVVLFGVGDLVTTLAGLGLGLAEANALPRHFLRNHGFAGMVALKLLSLGCCRILWRVLPRPHRIGVPLGLALLGAWVSAWNLLVVTVVVVA
jgi:hypothetical protein